MTTPTERELRFAMAIAEGFGWEGALALPWSDMPPDFQEMWVHCARAVMPLVETELAKVVSELRERVAKLYVYETSDAGDCYDATEVRSLVGLEPYR